MRKIINENKAKNTEPATQNPAEQNTQNPEPQRIILNDGIAEANEMIDSLQPSIENFNKKIDSLQNLHKVMFDKSLIESVLYQHDSSIIKQVKENYFLEFPPSIKEQAQKDLLFDLVNFSKTLWKLNSKISVKSSARNYEFLDFSDDNKIYISEDSKNKLINLFAKVVEGDCLELIEKAKQIHTLASEIYQSSGMVIDDYYAIDDYVKYTRAVNKDAFLTNNI